MSININGKYIGTMNNGILLRANKKLCRHLKIFLANICVIMARSALAKHYSADVERLISASNLLKSPLRSTMSIETENLYSYINYKYAIIIRFGFYFRDRVHH